MNSYYYTGSNSSAGLGAALAALGVIAIIFVIIGLAAGVLLLSKFRPRLALPY